MKEKITAFAPATVANVACGFDIMGFAITGSGDKVSVEFSDDNDLSQIVQVGKYAGLIPSQRDKNTAGVAIDHYLKVIGKENVKLKIYLEKNMPLGSGMGSSASSAVAAVVAVNHLFGEPLNKRDLIPFAMEGERIACGAAHADNAAPSLLGGFILIRDYSPLDIIQVPVSDDLQCVVLHPDIELKTSDSRKVLNRQLTIKDAITQSANAAGFMIGLLQNDLGLISRSMQDVIAEPQRGKLIPGFELLKKTAIEAGALGCSISGSGPAIFAICANKETVLKVEQKMKATMTSIGVNSTTYISPVNAPGAHII
jgi:homoserine kinase